MPLHSVHRLEIAITVKFVPSSSNVFLCFDEPFCVVSDIFDLESGLVS